MKVSTWREIKDNNDNVVHITRHARYQEIKYTMKGEAYFIHRDRRYYLSEVMNLHNKVHMPFVPDWLLPFDGQLSDSFFSGILIKFDDTCESIKAYTYIS